MNPVEANEAQRKYWLRDDGPPALLRSVVIGGPAEAPDVVPCPALVTIIDNVPVQVHVAYEMDEIELATLAQGGTLWLTTWGGLPIHRLEVQPRTPRDGGGPG